MSRDQGEQIDFILGLIKTYKLFYVEDPLHEDDFDGFAELTRKVGKRCLICGDDLFVTNVGRIQKGIKGGAANAVLIKPNQIGTLSDTLAAVKLAKRHDYVTVMSHRSGETPDETIAHLAVGWGCPLIKTGVAGGERVAKLNELIRIEEKLGKRGGGRETDLLGYLPVGQPLLPEPPHPPQNFGGHLSRPRHCIIAPKLSLCIYLGSD